MFSMLAKTGHKIMDMIEEYLVSILFAFISIEIFLQIVFRYVGWPLSWTEETARYLLIMAAFIACSRAVRDKRHLSVGILNAALRTKRQKMILSIISNLFCLFFFILMALYGGQVMLKFVAHPQYSPATRTNMLIPYGGMYLGFFLMTLRTVQILVNDLKILVGKREEV
jgi:C4-dicarboxylate transporter DctQ subunit